VQRADRRLAEGLSKERQEFARRREMYSAHGTDLRRQTRGEMTGRVMRLIAEEKALEQMNAVQREIATEWLDDRPLEEIADEVSLPVRVVQSWVATVEVIIDIELRRLREVYLCGYGRQGWIEM
jgi:hypothetical protein